MADLLVQHADGELSASESQRVAAHLAECPECRQELRLLERSLELARAVWREAAADAAAVPTGSRQPRPRRLPAVIGLAACTVLLLSTAVWVSLHDRPQPDVRQTAQNGHSSQRPPTEGPAVEDVDVEALIAREGRSARLAASARLLATQPGLELYRRRAERYLSEAYPSTTAAHSLIEQNVPIPVKEPES